MASKGIGDLAKALFGVSTPGPQPSAGKERARKLTPTTVVTKTGRRVPADSLVAKALGARPRR